MKQANGFTLIELLAAMVAGSLLLVSLGWSVSTLGREMRVDSKALSASQISQIAPALTRLIEGALPPDLKQPAIMASSDRLEIETSPPQVLGAVGPVKLALAVRRRPDGAALMMSMTPADTTAVFPPSVGTEQMLAGGFGDIRFDYRAPADRDRRLPDLVTIRFKSNDGQERRLSIAPKINSSGSCRFDPISMTCRQ